MKRKLVLLVVFVVVVFCITMLVSQCFNQEDKESVKEKTSQPDIIAIPAVYIGDVETTEVTISSVVEETEEIEEETEPVIESVYEYTEEELDLLARLIYSEAGIESYDTKLKIGSVVLNRMEDPYFPNTLREVIYQKNQFSVTFLVKADGIVAIEHPADEDSKKAALELLTGGSVLPQKVQVFYNPSYVKSGWVTTREPYGKYDHTMFAYIYEKGATQ